MGCCAPTAAREEEDDLAAAARAKSVDEADADTADEAAKGNVQPLDNSRQNALGVPPAAFNKSQRSYDGSVSQANISNCAFTREAEEPSGKLPELGLSNNADVDDLGRRGLFEPEKKDVDGPQAVGNPLTGGGKRIRDEDPGTDAADGGKKVVRTLTASATVEAFDQRKCRLRKWLDRQPMAPVLTNASYAPEQVRLTCDSIQRNRYLLDKLARSMHEETQQAAISANDTVEAVCRTISAER